MIKFFRRIRQSLLSENKVSKYLIYAIGEIILVVIGILIALQVNNWNQSNQQKVIEQTYLTNLLSDLRDQQSSIEIQLKEEQFFFETAGYIIKDFEKNKTLTLDSTFFSRASELRSRKTFVITDPTYTDLISSGNINILQNSNLKDKLIKYYQELERIEKVLQNNNSLLVDQVYLANYQKLGYDILSDLTSISERPVLHKHMVFPNYEPKLEEIAKKILSNENHLLEFMNNISVRNSVAIGNYLFIKELQTTTNQLIKELQTIIND